ncbi:hypothetical protein KGF57_000713 [Candida theae]|uniref:ribonuclease Z n=1 Tax=Candida theae TaxID=1198502 RepID=A0AAD5G0I9_9ASCO|nr:uncharacterized protein KGF57_000713 [Candida theae]KAI5965447.1 hypothetical protein KGF57_000713 [Candida theae]
MKSCRQASLSTSVSYKPFSKSKRAKRISKSTVNRDTKKTSPTSTTSTSTNTNTNTDTDTDTDTNTNTSTQDPPTQHTPFPGMFKFTTIAHKTNDASQPLIALTTRQGNRYLFGKIPEGTQRIINAIGSNEVRFPKLQTIFLTGTIFTWGDIGGLPGLFLTISDATKKGIRVVGECGLLSYIVATWRQFVFRLGIDLEIVDVDHDPDAVVKNDEIVVRAIKIQPKSATATSLEETSALAKSTSSKALTQIRKLASLMFPLDTSEVNSRDPNSYKSDPSSKDIHTHVQLPPASQLIKKRQDSLSYCIEFVPIPGKFDARKAKELGLKPGPIFKELVAGNSVVNEAGDTILPSQVVGPDRVLPKVLVIDIPSKEYYEPTVESKEWHRIEKVGLVYHFIGDDVTFDMTQYQTFLDKFPPDCKHLISHRSITNNIIINEKFALGHLKLMQIMPENFQLMNSDEFRPLSDKESNVNRLHALQYMGIDDTGVYCDNTNILRSSNESLYREMVQQEAQDASPSPPLLPLPPPVKFDSLKSRFDLNLNKTADNDTKPTNLKNLVHICTLGTGSALPSISRNVLSNLIRIPYQHSDGSITYRSIILDAGENTIGSMLRNFGQDGGLDMRQIFSELSLIHLSHLHADHHLGMISMINKWFELNSRDTDKRLYLVVPWQFITFVHDWYSLESQYNPSVDLSRLCMFSNEDFLQGGGESNGGGSGNDGGRLPEYEKLTIGEFEQAYDCGDIHRPIAKAPLLPVNTAVIDEMYDALGIESISTVRALHCAWSYSTAFKFRLNSNSSNTTSDNKVAPQFFKIAFSGDTRPNPKFCSMAHKSDLLIHEASLDSFWIDEAIAKKHTAMVEAVAVCHLMQCPNLLLTHFSSRYGMSNNCVAKSALGKEARDLQLQLLRKQPRVFDIFRNANLDKLKEIDIVFAYDLMNIRYGDFEKQEEKWPQLQGLFEVSSKKRKLVAEEEEKET